MVHLACAHFAQVRARSEQGFFYTSPDELRRSIVTRRGEIVR